MRQRLLIVYVSLVAAVIAALALPVAVSDAARHTQAVYIDRQGDTARFANLAEPALRSGQTVALQAEFDVYRAVYGSDAAVVNRAGDVVASSLAGFSAGDPSVERAVSAALAGERVGLNRVVWPWQDRPLVIAEPVGSGGDITGAAITISPTDRLRDATLRGWGMLGLVAFAALTLAGFAAWPLTGWMLRPVSDLDGAAHAIAGGRLAARVNSAAGPKELRRLALAFNAMADTIAHLMEQQRRFVYYASHQLRNPLTALRLRVETEADRDSILHDVDRLAGICDGLLAVAQAESMSARPVAGDLVDAAEVADDRVEGWSDVAAQAGVRLVRTGRQSAPTFGELGALDQILDALLDNAIKFSGSGSTVTVAVGVEADSIRVSVTDDGPGLAPDALERATEPFWRSPADQNKAGSGLGLAIAATLAAGVGGSLRLQPAVPKGLRADVLLPAWDQGLTSR